MKSLALIFALFIAGTANAALNPPGAFVPSECGMQTNLASAADQVTIERVCLGHSLGTEKAKVVRSVTFIYTDGSVRLFTVANTSSLYVALPNGRTKSMYYLVDANGERSTMKVIETRTGDVESASGRLDEVDYLVPEFEPVFVTQ